MNKKGISLIALVVTIIVLLILASITIAVTLGPDGIIEKAKASKLDQRYATIKDKVEVRENSLYMSFEQEKAGELELDFIQRLKNEGLFIESDDEYEAQTRTLKLGKTNNTEKPYTYYLNIMDGSLEGKKIADAIKELPDSSENVALKNMTFTIKTTSANQNVSLPISNANGLQVKWDAINNPSVISPVLGQNPSELYSTPGTYEIQIIGEVQGESTFGGISSFPIHELIYWGENKFTKFETLGQSISGTIPSPSRNSFTEVTSFDGLFRFSEISGSIPKNIFANCTKVTEFNSLFTMCFNLTGSIPKGLFNNC